MKRIEKIIVDLKNKTYDMLKLKQLDTTELKFKILDNSLEVDLSNLTAEIIFKKPNGLVVIQGCTVEEDTIRVVLIEDCLRISGKATMEINLKEGTETVSSFSINVFIEKTAKEDLKSDNTQTYIERFEEAITQLETDANKLLNDIAQARSRRNRKHRAEIRCNSK